MELQEAINHAREVAEKCPADNRDCAYQHDQLADWLEELKHLRTILGDEYDLDRLCELAQAEREGRIVLRSAGAGKQCGSCGHWHRIRDTRRGTCDVRQWLRDRYGASDPGASFTPAQSYGACRDYIPVEGRGNG